MKINNIAVYISATLCFFLSLVAVVHFRNSPEPWRFYFSLAGYIFFFLILMMQILAGWLNRKNKK